MSVNRSDAASLEAAHAIRPVQGARAPGRAVPLLTLAGLVAVMAFAWWYLLWQAGEVLPAEALRRLWTFGQRLAGAGSDRPPAVSDAAEWRVGLRLAVETLGMSVLGAGMAGVGALATIAFSSRTLTGGVLAARHPYVGRTVFVSMRGVHILARAVPDLVWAMIVVFVLRPGILAGAIALAIHNFGVLGRLGSDVIDDLHPGPQRSLRSSGASNLQVLAYGVLPQVLPQFVTFLLYRWEVIIRASAVVGFITAAGLGYQLRLDLSFFRYTDVALLLVIYILLVWAVDLTSSSLRRLAR